ncbi:uncharacterized protein [Engystomops pustulosus]
MNMFDSESPAFRIPVKVWSMKVSDKDADPAGVVQDEGNKKTAPKNKENGTAGLEDNRKNHSSDPARESDVCKKLLEQVKQDVRLSDGEDRSGAEASTTSSYSTKDKRKSKGRREEKTREKKDEGEGGEWTKAKAKVEEFLDFPGVMAAVAYRNEAKSKKSSRSSTRKEGGEVSRGQPVPLPNTRHNALFLRDHVKAAEALLLNPQGQKDRTPPPVDPQRPATKSRDRGAKGAKKSTSLVDSMVPETSGGTER